MGSFNPEATLFDLFGGDGDFGFHDSPLLFDTDMIDGFGPSDDPDALENDLLTCSTPLISDTLFDPALLDVAADTSANIIGIGQAPGTNSDHQRISSEYQRTVEHPINLLELNETSANDGFLAFNDHIPDHVLQDPLCAPPQREPNSISYLRNAENVAGLADTNLAPRAPNNPRQRRSVEEWEEMRPIIEKLRMKEGKSLTEIRQILTDDHKFSASEKAYKDQFRIWGLWVNLNQRKAHQMLQIEQQRKVEEEKETSFRYKGVEVLKAKLERYRKTTPPADSIQSTTSAFSDLSFYTPQNSCLRKQDLAAHKQDKSINTPINIAFANDQRNCGCNPKDDGSQKRILISLLEQRIETAQDYSTFLGDQRTQSVLEALHRFKEICANLEPASFVRISLNGNMVHDLLEYSSILGEESSNDLLEYSSSNHKLHAVLEILLCQATALIKIEELASAETVLDQILWLAKRPWRTDPLEWFQIWLRSVQLLIAMYYQQGRYWLMEKLLASTIGEAKTLLGTNDSDKILELQELQGLLLITRMCDFDWPNFKFRGFVANHADRQAMRVLLEEISFSASTEIFHLGVLDYLRKIYTMEKQLDELKPILRRLEILFRYHPEPMSWGLFNSYACIGLIQSYCSLDRFVDAKRCLDFFYPMICEVPKPGYFVEVPNVRELARSTNKPFCLSSGASGYPRLPWPRYDLLGDPYEKEASTAMKILKELKAFEASEPISDYSFHQGFRQFCLKPWGHVVMPWEVKRDV